MIIDKRIINIVFALFPLSFIFGNLITNINILLFCFLGIFHLKDRILKEEYNFIIKIILSFFLVILFSTVISFTKSIYFGEYDNGDLTRLIKSIAFFRFFLMLLIAYLLSKFEVLNFKYFFIFTGLLVPIVSLDVIYQYVFGLNIIGLKSYAHFNSGFFGDELIAGGFIQNFSFFTIFLAAYVSNNKKISFFLVIIAICILGIGILVSGNRMPLVLFLLGLALVFLLNSKMRIATSVGILILLLLSKFIISSNNRLQQNYYSYFYNIKNIAIGFTNISESSQEKAEKIEAERLDSTNKKDKTLKNVFPGATTSHYKLFMTSLDTWKKNKLFGNGIKSFRKDCFELENPWLCSNHPHNYYFEILTETGMVGILLVFTIGIYFIAFVIKNFGILRKSNNFRNFILLSALISLILETFPFKSTGSIFTTNNATYLILMASIVLSYDKLIKKE